MKYTISYSLLMGNKNVSVIVVERMVFLEQGKINFP